MRSCRSSFNETEWTTSAAGGRSKTVQGSTRQFRIVELDRNSYSAEVCLTGHIGYLIDGEMRIEFENGNVVIAAGDGLEVPDGIPHTPHPISEKVTLFLTETTP